MCDCIQVHAQKSDDRSRPAIFLWHGLQGGGEGEAGQQCRGPHSSCGPPLFFLWCHCLYWNWSTLYCFPFGVPGSTNLWQYGYLHQYRFKYVLLMLILYFLFMTIIINWNSLILQWVRWYYIPQGFCAVCNQFLFHAKIQTLVETLFLRLSGEQSQEDTGHRWVSLSSILKVCNTINLLDYITMNDYAASFHVTLKWSKIKPC